MGDKKRKDFVVTNEQYISRESEKEIHKEISDSLRMLRGVRSPLVGFP
jgi:hypothetical protein